MVGFKNSSFAFSLGEFSLWASNIILIDRHPWANRRSISLCRSSPVVEAILFLWMWQSTFCDFPYKE